jgi:hypothetical protein
MLTLLLTTIIFALIVFANSNLTRARSRLLLLQAQYAAESAADSAIAQLNNGNESYTGTTSEVTVLTSSTYRSTYTVSVAAGSDAKEKLITAVGKVYAPKSSSIATFSRSIEVTAQRTSSSTSSSVVAKNIVQVASSVKDLQAKDIFVNSYIQLDKNVNNLIAENITVADKYPSATNCSIYGTGTLTKPATFSDPTQTKTKLTLAYNNCITPPGNTTNSNFIVNANQSSISKITSTYIPWSHYMDASYQSAPGGCNDWTTGSFPRDIPSTGNTKKTDYPNNSSGVSSSCGTSGNLSLSTGQYNIKDHVHIRANLCETSGCTPTFNNPDSTIKFIFVEGTANFNRLLTASGSGPIVLVTYGADPSSRTGACPLGGALYLANSGNTEAPALYLLSNNGLCLDKTKFDAQPALGGLSGKNVYIATNSGTPFDLALDTSFPADQIPIDLSWRAIRYRRL